MLAICQGEPDPHHHACLCRQVCGMTVPAYSRTEAREISSFPVRIVVPANKPVQRSRRLINLVLGGPSHSTLLSLTTSSSCYEEGSRSQGTVFTENRLPSPATRGILWHQVSTITIFTSMREHDASRRHASEGPSLSSTWPAGTKGHSLGTTYLVAQCPTFSPAWIDPGGEANCRGGAGRVKQRRELNRHQLLVARVGDLATRFTVGPHPMPLSVALSA